MDGKDYFMMGFEKEARAAGLLKRIMAPKKVVQRGKNMQQLQKKRLSEESWAKSFGHLGKEKPITLKGQTGNPIVDKGKQMHENVKQKANSPGMQLKKHMGKALIAGGVGAYGMHRLNQPQRAYYPQQPQRR